MPAATGRGKSFAVNQSQLAQQPSIPRRSQPQPGQAQDLTLALSNCGLQQYARRLEDMGYTSVRQLLRVGRGSKFEELLEQLKPMPGHRTRLVNFVEEHAIARNLANQQGSASHSTCSRICETTVSNTASPSASGLSRNPSGSTNGALAAYGNRGGARRRPASAQLGGRAGAGTQPAASKPRAASASASRIASPRVADAAPKPAHTRQPPQLHAPSAPPARAASADEQWLDRLLSHPEEALELDLAVTDVGSGMPTPSGERTHKNLPETAVAGGAAAAGDDDDDDADDDDAAQEEARDAAALAFLSTSLTKERALAMLASSHAVGSGHGGVANAGGAFFGAGLAADKAAEAGADARAGSKAQGHAARPAAHASGELTCARDATAAASPNPAGGDDTYDEDFERYVGSLQATKCSMLSTARPVTSGTLRRQQAAEERAATALARPAQPLTEEEELQALRDELQQASVRESGPLCDESGEADAASSLPTPLATQQKMLRLLQERSEAEADAADAAAAAAAAERERAGESVGGYQSPEEKAAKAAPRRPLLANSLDSFRAPTSVLWRPHGGEMSDAVAFVLTKLIEERGECLLMRYQPPADAASKSPMKAGRNAAPVPAPMATPALAPAPAPASAPRCRASAPQATPAPRAPAVASPGPPPEVMRAMMAAGDVVEGLRYSLDLSPIREATAAEEAARRALRATNPAHSLAATSMWEDAGWQPPTGFEIFSDDEGLGDDDDDDVRGLHARRPPSVATVHHHISLISRAAHMGAEASVVGLAYVERLISITNQPIAPHNWKKIVLVAWLLAAKMWDDDAYENPDFSAVLGLPVDKLNALEAVFVRCLDYQLGVSASEYARYYFALRSICQVSSAHFPLRPLDEAVEKRLQRLGAAAPMKS